MTVRTCGQYTSENVGMSSETWVRIPRAVNPRFPGEGSSALGKSGPKVSPKGVADGHLVYNPELLIKLMERRRRQGRTSKWIEVKIPRLMCRKIRT